MIEDKEHDEMVAKNKWLENFDEVIAFIKRATAPKKWTEKGAKIPGECYWSWVGNSRCKYIDLRIDMRDGGFVLLDRDKNRISLKQLMWQYGDECEKEQSQKDPT